MYLRNEPEPPFLPQQYELFLDCSLCRDQSDAKSDHKKKNAKHKMKYRYGLWFIFSQWRHVIG